ncbi:BTAD domain-containing putative transcriptional regulator [Glycomyces sp. NPDC047369]
MVSLDLRILGPLEVRIDGAVTTVPSSAARTLLGVLAANANKVVGTGTLTRALFGRTAPADAGGQVRRAVGAIRERLGGAHERLETVGDGFRLRAATAEMDLLRAREHERLARRAAAAGDLAGAAAALRGALSEWRGPILAGLDGPVIESIRLRYAEYRHELLQMRLDADLRLGRHEAILDELNSLVEANPARQGLVLLQMRALDASGRKAKADLAYRRLREHLQASYGTEPDPSLRELHAAILDLPAPSRERPSNSPDRGSHGGTGVGTGEPALLANAPRDLWYMPRRTSSDGIGVSIFLGDGRTHDLVQAAVEGLLIESGWEPFGFEPPVVGSWFRRFRARVASGAGSEVEQTAELQRRIQFEVVQGDESAAVGPYASSAAALVAALRHEERACISLGPLLVVKAGGKILVTDLQPTQIAWLGRNPALLADPEDLLQGLNNLAVQGHAESDSTGNARGRHRRTPETLE